MDLNIHLFSFKYKYWIAKKIFMYDDKLSIEYLVLSFLTSGINGFAEDRRTKLMARNSESISNLGGPLSTEHFDN